jgi:integrase
MERIIRSKAADRYGKRSEMRPSGIRIQEKGGKWNVNVPAKMGGGKRVRHRFNDRASAEAFAEDAERGILEMGREFFLISREERLEFIRLLPRIREAGVTLEQVVNEGLPRLTSEQPKVTVRGLIDQKMEEKSWLHEEGNLRPASLADFRYRTRKLLPDWGDIRLADLDGDGDRGRGVAEDLVAWVNDTASSAAQKSKLFAVWQELLRDASQRGMIRKNPLDRITDDQRQMLYGQRGKKPKPPVVAVPVVKRMLEATLEERFRKLLAPLALGFFCGLRTQEIQRLDWSAVRLDEERVEIDENVAKTGYIRNVDLCPAAVAWLSLVQQPGGLVYDPDYPSQYRKQFGQLVELVGDGYKQNGMRHTYASALYAKTKDQRYVRQQLGHMEKSTMLFRHYVQLMPKEEAKKFFALRPKVRSLNSAEEPTEAVV